MDHEQAAVKKGAKLLDKILPGWHKQVHLERLWMGDPSLCMLGQLFGPRVEGALAQEMYPEEMKTALGRDGYAKAIPYGLIGRLMVKLGIRDTDADSYSALYNACAGHDNTCLWAEAVADRMVQDVEAT